MEDETRSLWVTVVSSKLFTDTIGYTPISPCLGASVQSCYHQAVRSVSFHQHLCSCNYLPLCDLFDTNLPLWKTGACFAPAQHGQYIAHICLALGNHYHSQHLATLNLHVPTLHVCIVILVPVWWLCREVCNGLRG